MGYERDNIRRMQGYRYGEQPEQQDIVKLNTNENPFPPSPAVQQALVEFSSEALRRYPSATARELRTALAQHHGVSPEEVVLTHAGDEALRLAFTTFLPPGGVFGCSDPSYSLYPVLAAIQDARVEAVPLAADWSLPTHFATTLNAVNAKLICVVNPHAPSGHLTEAGQLRELARELNGVLLIDEAYVDFVDPTLAHDTTQLLHEHDNVLLLRTFSKGYSLAGLRLGYLLGAESLISPILHKTRDSYNVDAISQAVGLAALKDQSYAAGRWADLRSERDRQRGQLTSLGFNCAASQANFLLAEAPADYAAAELTAELKRCGVLVRYFDQPRLKQSLRISIGTRAENERLNSVLRELLA